MPKKYDLTEAERRLLEKHLAFYQDLASGERRPTTDAQRHFVRVAERKDTPNTEHEWAFVKWQVERDRQEREQAHRRFAGYDDFEDRVPKGDWFADDQLGKLGPYRRSRRDR